MTTAQLIHSIRKKSGLKQRELAIKLGVKQQKISEWENGKHEPSFATVQNIIKICKHEKK